MPSTLEDIEDVILSELREVSGLSTVDTFTGEIEDLLGITVQRLPAVWVMFSGCEYGEKSVIGVDEQIGPETFFFKLVLIVSALRGKKDGARGAYEIIEAIRDRLRGKFLEPAEGYLWPSEEALLAIKNGRFAYGLEYVIRVNN